jgi:hypothetical protein
MKTHTIYRDEVSQVLKKWQDGELSAKDVHHWAVDRYAMPSYEAEDEVVNEVLSELDMLDIYLITVQDIPALLEAVSLPADRIDEVSNVIHRQWQSISLDERQRIWRYDPLYY